MNKETYNAEILINLPNGTWYTSIFYGIPLEIDSIEYATKELTKEGICCVSLSVYNDNVDEGESGE